MRVVKKSVVDVILMTPGDLPYCAGYAVECKKIACKQKRILLRDSPVPSLAASGAKALCRN